MLAGIHFFGAFLLLAATILILITTITAPVVDQMGLLRVSLADDNAGSEVSFGTFGWCIINGRSDGGNLCSTSHIGYNPAEVMAQVDNSRASDYGSDSARILTRVMVLHPIATGLCFIGTLLGLGAGVIGSFLASMMAALAFVVTLVALVCDFVLFSIVRNIVNDNISGGSRAFYAEGLWTALASCICSFLASIILFLTCCFGRSRRYREKREAPPVRRRPWQRRWR